MFNFDDPKLRPLWLRILVVASCIGWGLVELFVGGQVWAIAFLGVGAFLFWRLLLTYAPPPEDD